MLISVNPALLYTSMHIHSMYNIYTTLYNKCFGIMKGILSIIAQLYNKPVLHRLAILALHPQGWK